MYVFQGPSLLRSMMTLVPSVEVQQRLHKRLFLPRKYPGNLAVSGCLYCIAESGASGCWTLVVYYDPIREDVITDSYSVRGYKRIINQLLRVID
jgi:hypothetical protein